LIPLGLLTQKHADGFHNHLNRSWRVTETLNLGDIVFVQLVEGLFCFTKGGEGFAKFGLGLLLDDPNLVGL
jgi:hypothetical protein